MNRKRILSIGRDSSVFDMNSQLHARFKTYDSYHAFTLVILNPGKRQEAHIGNSRVVMPGGKSIVTAFIRTFLYTINLSFRQTFDLVTTQDVLYAGVLGLAVSKIKRLPLYVQLHGDYLDNEHWFKSEVGKFNKLMNFVGVRVLKRAHSVRVVSERLRAQVIANYALTPENVISIPIGTDIETFILKEKTARKPVILFAQRLIPEKEPLLFVEVTSDILLKYPETSVTIAGEGWLQKEMEEEYRKNNLLHRVQFMGNVSHAELVTLYQSSSCYLHTASWEGWGMPMIESMASGCPVVTTDSGCAGEAVRHEETGLVVADGTKAALTKEVARLLTDPILWDKISKQGVSEAQKWSFTSLANKNMQWYAGK